MAKKGGEAEGNSKPKPSIRKPRNTNDLSSPTTTTTHKESPTMAQAQTTGRKINFSGMGKPIPAATYEAVFDDFAYQQSKPKPDAPDQTPKDMYKLMFRIVDKGEGIENRKLSRFFVIEGNALFYFFDALVKLGADPEELAPEDEAEQEVDIEAIMANLRGAHCWLKVVNGTYNGRETSNIDEIISMTAD